MFYTFQGSGISSSGIAGPSTSLSSRSPLENDGSFDSRLGVSVESDFFLNLKIRFAIFI